MKYFSLLLAIIIHSHFYSQCNQTNSTQLLIIGDSWSVFKWDFDAHMDIFEKYALPEITAYSSGSIASTNGNNQLSQNGKEARNYLTPTRKTLISDALTFNPEIKVTEISLGGNDFLGEWDTTWTNQQIDSLFDVVMDSTYAIIDFIRSIDSSMHFLISGYDYPNFEEAINDFFIPSQHPFYSTWNDMLKPNFYQINTLLARIHSKIQSSVSNYNYVDFVDNLGQMQYHFGQNYPLPFPPGGSYPSYSVSIPGGDTTYPSPLESMNYYQLAYDAFHLSPQGFRYFIGNQFEHFYFDFFRNYDFTHYAEKNLSGYVNHQSFGQDSILLGSSNQSNNAAILSFKIHPNLDTLESIKRASIYLRRKNVINNNPIEYYNLITDFAVQKYGNDSSLTVSDYSYSANNIDFGCVYGSASENNDWIRIDLPSSIYSSFKPNQRIQFKFKLAIIDTLTDQALVFYNDTNDYNRPILDIEYGIPSGTTTNINENTELELKIFPNPTNNQLNIKFKDYFNGTVTVNSMEGKIIHKYPINEQKSIQLDMSRLKTGMYILQLSNKQNSDLGHYIINKL